MAVADVCHKCGQVRNLRIDDDSVRHSKQNAKSVQVRLMHWACRVCEGVFCWRQQLSPRLFQVQRMFEAVSLARKAIESIESPGGKCHKTSAWHMQIDCAA